MLKKILSISFIWSMLFCNSCFAAKDNDVEKIKSVVVKEVSVDEYGKRVPYREITKPFISGNYALTSIIFTEGSSQLVLEKKNGKWKIIGGDGGALIQENLTGFGVPLKDAQNIMKQQEASWKKKGSK